MSVMEQRLEDLLSHYRREEEVEKVVVVEELLNTYKEFNHTDSSFFDYLTSLRKSVIMDEDMRLVVKRLWYSNVIGYGGN